MTATSSVTEKVAKLLAQAEKAGTEAEAQTFMDKAQQLATLHSIDLAKARHITIAKQRTTPVQRTITIGVRGTKGLNTLVTLINGIARANDVILNVAHNSTAVYAFGFAEDIDITEALFASLSVQMASAAAAWKREGTWRNDEVYRRDRYGWGEYKPVTWLTARLDFQQSFAVRVGSRLARAKRAAEAQAEAAETTDTADTTGNDEVGTALVLVEKRETVHDYHRQHSNARGTYRGYRDGGATSSRIAGAAAGERAKLSSHSQIGGARKALA